MTNENQIDAQDETNSALDNLAALIDFTQMASYSGEIIRPGNLACMASLMEQQLDIVIGNVHTLQDAKPTPTTGLSDEDSARLDALLREGADLRANLARQAGQALAETVAAIAERDGRAWSEVLRDMSVDTVKFAQGCGIRTPEIQAYVDGIEKAARENHENADGIVYWLKVIGGHVSGPFVAPNFDKPATQENTATDPVQQLRAAVVSLAPLFDGFTISSVVDILATFDLQQEPQPQTSHWHKAIADAFGQTSGVIVGALSVPEAAHWISARAHNYALQDKAA